MLSANESEIFLVARFNLDKDWHTYWINPGDSGDPASFNWDLPEGFNISEANLAYSGTDTISSSNYFWLYK